MFFAFIHFNGHNSVTAKHICTKFGTETKNNVTDTELTTHSQLNAWR